MQKITTEQKIFYTLRLACAMCFIGHGAFGLITKAVWCNYFGVFGIGQATAYSLMPVVGSVDLLCGLFMLVLPFRGVFAWLVVWGLFTALLRPASGEPFAEAIERAGNYGAPFILLLLVDAATKNNRRFLARLSANVSLDEQSLQKLTLGLQLVCFFLFAGHGWLNLLAKKGLLLQYQSLGFSNPHFIGQVIGFAEITAAVFLLLRPSPTLVFALFVWKMSSELFYPSHEIFEWIERGGSYGALLALWFALRHRSVSNREHRFHFPFFSKTFSV